LPIIGIGTYKITDEQIMEEVLTIALANNYIMIDTVEIYKNHHIIGNVLIKLNIERHKIWITTKMSWNTIKRINTSQKNFIKQTLNNLQTNYIDLCLLHAPTPEHNLNGWDFLRNQQKENKIKNIGLSNFNLNKLKKFISEIRPDEHKYIYCNQIEVNPFLYRKELIDFCQEKKIKVVAYGMFNKITPEIIDIATKLKITPYQLILQWCIDKNIYVLPKSINKSHILENNILIIIYL